LQAQSTARDIVVVLAMIVLSTIGIGTVEVQSGPVRLLTIGASLVGVVAVLVLFVRYVAEITSGGNGASRGR
jgi:hypothetical protein